jgi:transposase InsO family protein
VDYYSRFYEVVVMRSTTTQRVIAALSDIFARFGFPHSLKSDNGPQFVSEEFRRYLQENGIEHRKSPPLRPQANGAEKSNTFENLESSKSRGKEVARRITKIPLSISQHTTG